MDVIWLEPSICSFRINKSVDIWSISINPLLPVPGSRLAILPADEKDRANRFYRQNDRNRFLISRWALRTILARYLGLEPSAMIFEAGKNKKPHIKNPGGLSLHYNLSHSAENILLAVSDEAIGADVEFINRDFGYSEVLADNFSLEEVSYINEADHINRFFVLWTRKEAITKATAQGLDCDLTLLPGLEGPHSVQTGIIASDNDWQISSFIINEKYAASVATNPLPGTLQFFSFDAASDTPTF
ncbi:MAG: 4'-phosphopantetheinyl transferase family protein [Mucilaginibacter sp.]